MHLHWRCESITTKSGARRFIVGHDPFHLFEARSGEQGVVPTD
jgi:hypothetical protein